MMSSVFDIANAFVAYVKQAYAQDVAIVAYYGSYATGTATDRSDLDLYYIPDDGKAGDLYRSFVLDGRPFEFWPVSWAFAEKIASGKQHWAVAPSILANAQVLYARSEEDLTRFEGLGEEIARLQKPENIERAVSCAWDAFKSAPFYLESLRFACACQDKAGAREMGSQLVNVLLDCLTLVNQRTFTRDWTSDIEPLRNLIQKPDRTLELVETIMTSTDVVKIESSAETFLRETREIIIAGQSECKTVSNLQEVFNGYFPAIQEYVGKILSACEQRNLIKASYWSTKMQSEVGLMLAQSFSNKSFSGMNLYIEYGGYQASLGWPDLVQAVETRDFDYIAIHAQSFAQQVKEYLLSNSVSLNMFESFEEVQEYISCK
jgi:hypothetical protein